MKMKDNIDYLELMKEVLACEGEVFFQNETDKINLKSALSQYVFLTIANNPRLRKNAQLICENEKDYERLAGYIDMM